MRTSGRAGRDHSISKRLALARDDANIHLLLAHGRCSRGVGPRGLIDLGIMRAPHQIAGANPRCVHRAIGERDSSRFPEPPAARDRCGHLLPARRDCANRRHRRQFHRRASDARRQDRIPESIDDTRGGNTRSHGRRAARDAGARDPSPQPDDWYPIRRTDRARANIPAPARPSRRGSTGCSRPAHASSTAFRYARVVSATYSASLYRPSILSAEIPMRTISGTCSSAYRSPGDSRYRASPKGSTRPSTSIS